MHKSLLKQFFFASVVSFSTITASASTLVVGNKDAATVSLLDIKNNQIIHTIKTGIGPHEVAVSPNKKYALVANYGDQTVEGNSLTLISVNTKKVINTIVSDELKRVHGIQWFKDNRHALVTSEVNKQVVKVDIIEGKVVAKVSTQGRGSHMLVISPDETIAAVANLGSDNISIIDLSKMKLKQTIATGKQSEGIDISPDNRYVWVTNRAEDSVSVIDVDSMKITKILDSKGFPIRVKITPDNKYALVTNAQGNSMTIFDAQNYKAIKTFSFENDVSGIELKFPVGVLVDDAGKFAYVAHMGGAKISKIDLRSLKRVALLDGGSMPDGMGYVK